MAQEAESAVRQSADSSLAALKQQLDERDRLLAEAAQQKSELRARLQEEQRHHQTATALAQQAQSALEAATH